MTNHVKLLLQQSKSFIGTYPEWVIILRWATATGKTSLSIELAREYVNIEIISADSRQIYRYMNVGTDKVSQELRDEIPHHMIDIVDPDETYTAGQWKEKVEKLIPEIHARWHIPLIVWGTGLYIDMIYKNFNMPDVAPDPEWRAVMESREVENPWFLHSELTKIDPDEAQKHHPNSLRYILRALEICHKTGQKKSELAQELPVQRPLLMIGLRRQRDDTNIRINKRIKEMLADGVLMEENKKLLEMWYALGHTAMNGIWYKEMIWYIQWEYGQERCEELLKRNTHRYAKRQRSRFRRYIAESKMKPKDEVEYVLIELE